MPAMSSRPDQDIATDRGVGRHRRAPQMAAQWSMVAFARPAKTRRFPKPASPERWGVL